MKLKADRSFKSYNVKLVACGHARVIGVHFDEAYSTVSCVIGFYFL